jgi:hypothetical protein
MVITTAKPHTIHIPPLPPPPPIQHSSPQPSAFFLPTPQQTHLQFSPDFHSNNLQHIHARAPTHNTTTQTYYTQNKKTSKQAIKKQAPEITPRSEERVLR